AWKTCVLDASAILLMTARYGFHSVNGWSCIMSFSRESSINKIKDLGAVVSQEKFASVFADLIEAEQTGNSDQEKRSLLESAKKEARRFLESQGMKRPPNATVEITQNSPIGVKICVNSHCVVITVTAV